MPLVISNHAALSWHDSGKRSHATWCKVVFLPSHTYMNVCLSVSRLSENRIHNKGNRKSLCARYCHRKKRRIDLDRILRFAFGALAEERRRILIKQVTMTKADEYNFSPSLLFPLTWFRAENGTDDVNQLGAEWILTPGRSKGSKKPTAKGIFHFLTKVLCDKRLIIFHSNRQVAPVRSVCVRLGNFWRRTTRRKELYSSCHSNSHPANP